MSRGAAVQGLDLAVLRRRIERAASRWRPGVVVDDLTPLTGGRSSLTFSATVMAPRQRAAIVVKAAPPGLAPVRNRDVLRQARVMDALAGARGVRVPPVLFTDAGDPPDEPPLVAMAHVAGECHEPILSSPGDRPPPDVVATRAATAARMLAALHQVRPADVGLGDEPQVELTAEVDRWTRALDTVDDGLRSGYLECRDRLLATVPAALAPVVVHGDYRLGNLLCHGREVGAIIDWEIWACADPRIDLSWFLYFADDAGHAIAQPGRSGMPTVEELLTAYTGAGGDATTDLVWFHALTRYKEAGATALIVKHQRRAERPAPDTEDLAAATPRFIEDALRILG